jgi:glycosyltransferase involved in cell wall biosynthesis
MLKVLLVSPLPPPYGGISHWTSMIKRYSDKQNDIKLDVLNTAPTWRNIHDLSIWKRVIGGTLQLMWNVIVFIKMILKKRPDAVHLTTSGQLAIGRDIIILLICRMLNIRSIYHIRFGRLPQILCNQTKEAKLFKYAARMADHIIAIDQATYNALINVFDANKLSLISNCYDPETLPPVNQMPLRKIIFIGWVIPTKGIKELVEAWSLVDSHDWTLSVVGPGDSDYIEDIKQYSKGKATINFTGAKNHHETMKLLNEASIFILPSHTEGFPNVVLEAMASGKAVIATKVGAIPEMLSKERGVLVSPKNSLELSKAIASLISDSVLRDKLAKSAYEYASINYSVEAIFSQYRNLWVASKEIRHR